MNPWKQSILSILRDIVRFALWVVLAVNGVMFAVFSVLFTYQFLRHLWSFCDRVLFPGEW